MNEEKGSVQNTASKKSYISTVLSVALVAIMFIFSSQQAYAHCDSYDGPTVKDAMKALETNNVKLVTKWISSEQEPEITSLFNITYSLRNGDKEIYTIVEKHFLETLVRLHRETEGAPYTGLKAAGTTKPIVQMTDKAIEDKDVDKLLNALSVHIGKVIKEKYNKVAALDKVKNTSTEKGREFVAAYVDYTHTVEALHDLVEPGNALVHKH